MLEKITNFFVTTELTVRWRDLDAYNHVNNSVYLNFFEEARIAYFYKIGKITNTQIQFGDANAALATTLVKTSVDFKAQAHLADPLIIGIRYLAIRKIFMDAEYAVFNKDTGKLLAIGTSSQVAIDRHTFKPIRVPDFIIRGIEAIEQRKMSSDLE